MSYDFDTPIDRYNTYSDKWDKYRNTDIIPLWVADMDFASPPAILEALRKRIDHGILGYTRTPDPLIETVCEHLKHEYQWEVSPEWLIFIPGLVCGLNIACAAIGEANDSVLTAAPVYPPFFSAPKNANRKVITAPLAHTGDRWYFDSDCLEKSIQSDTRLFLLCNPHNPVGRCFDKEELLVIAKFCEKHDLVICADEIHNELILDPSKKHIPIASLDSTIANRTITLIAPSKTYNIPGLGASIAIISDPALRMKFKRAMAGIVPHVNVFGLVAALAAYRDCKGWRGELLDYLRSNRDFVAQSIGAIAGLSVSPVEATYLSWIDTHQLNIEDPAKFFENAGVGLSDGKDFGGKGFVRLNFGCQRGTLETALLRMKQAVEKKHW
jgi:cystathionine beta-lyase